MSVTACGTSACGLHGARIKTKATVKTQVGGQRFDILLEGMQSTHGKR